MEPKSLNQEVGPMPRPKTRYSPKPRKELLEIGERLKQIRKQQGWSQSELGEKLGLSQRAISEYECGRNRLPAATLLKITHLLGVSLKEFTGQSKQGVRQAKTQPAPSRRILRRLQLIAQLPRRDQQMILRLIDNTLAATGNGRRRHVA